MDKTQLGEEIRSLLSELPAASGTLPCAFFDERLDCIRFIVRDCSVREDRISQRLTILVDQYPEEGQNPYVGFTIKGAMHFMEDLNRTGGDVAAVFHGG